MDDDFGWLGKQDPIARESKWVAPGSLQRAHLVDAPYPGGEAVPVINRLPARQSGDRDLDRSPQVGMQVLLENHRVDASSRGHLQFHVDDLSFAYASGN